MYDDELMDAMTEEQMDYEDEAAMQSWAEFYRGDYDDYYEDWDRYEVGFDPYMGCYSDDC
jgi:hypothetical protein